MSHDILEHTFCFFKKKGMNSLYLQRSKSKGNDYLYLRNYSNREHYSSNRVTVFSFGRVEVALKNMYKWRADFSEFPIELRELGCGINELEVWIQSLETGKHKTGRTFKSAI